MAAVVLPEILMQQGEFLRTWMDARWMGAAVGAAVYFWRRNVLLTIVVGMLTFLPLHLLASW
jgi:branched-subunit amino acid transport protein